MKEYIVPFTDDADMEKFESEHGTNGELIRCKDCKCYVSSLGFCGNDLGLDFISEDGYCCRAVRKEECFLVEKKE